MSEKTADLKDYVDYEIEQYERGFLASNDTLDQEVSKKQRYLWFHEESCAKLIEITKAKNADYTGDSDDPFANFRSVEANGIASTEQGFLVRMSDKMARITSYIQKGELQVKDESVEDTLLDLANYCILMAGYLKDKKGEL